MWTEAVVVLALTAADVGGRAEAETTPPDTAVVLKLGGARSATLLGLGGLGLGGLGAGALGLAASPATAGGFSVERAVASNVSVTLGFDGSFGQPALEGGSLTLSGALEPGVRLYRSRALRGLWVGASLPVGLTRMQASPATAFSLWSAGVAVTGGVTHVFESGLLIGVSAGPVAQVSGADGAGGTGTRSLQVALRGEVSVGYAF